MCFRSWWDKAKKKITDFQPGIWTVAANIAMWIMTFAIVDSLFDYLSLYHLFVRYFSLLAAGLAAVGLFSPLLAKEKYSKKWTIGTFVSAMGLIFVVSLLFWDFDGNGIPNYVELKYDLNPWIADSKSNDDLENAANLVDGCVVRWREEGSELNYEKLPADTDADGCFDEIEREEGGDLPYDFTSLPSFVHVPAGNPSKASIATRRWTIRLGSGGTIATSYNPQVFSWQNFRFNNRRQFSDYVLSLEISAGQNTKSMAIKCSRKEGNDLPVSERVWTTCSLSSAQMLEVADFMQQQGILEAAATWQIELGRETLFPNNSDRNEFMINLSTLQ